MGENWVLSAPMWAGGRSREGRSLRSQTGGMEGPLREQDVMQLLVSSQLSSRSSDLKITVCFPGTGLRILPWAEACCSPRSNVAGSQVLGRVAAQAPGAHTIDSCVIWGGCCRDLKRPSGPSRVPPNAAAVDQARQGWWPETAAGVNSAAGPGACACITARLTQTHWKG